MEINEILNQLLIELENRKNEAFVPSLAKQIFKKLEVDGNIQQHDFELKIKDFYESAYEYLKAWKNTNKNFDNFSSFMLKDIPNRDSFTCAIEELVVDSSLSDINVDDIFDEFSMLKTFTESKKNTNKNWFTEKSVAEKWAEVFFEFQEKNIPHLNIKKIVEFLLCLPGTNAFIERVFSLINDFWTVEKTQMQRKC